MSKLFFTAFSAGVLAFTACSQNAGTGKEFTLKNYQDSMIAKIGNVDCYIDVSVDYPENGSFALVNNIREWIADKMGGTAATDYNDPDSLVRGYINGKMGEMGEFAGNMQDTEAFCSSTLEIKKIYDNDGFVSFSVSGYDYSGGAHGLGYMKGTTFRKSDGKVFGENMLDMTHETEIRKLIAVNLIPYFDGVTEDEIRTTEDLKDILLLPEGELIPLPKAEPYIDNDSIVFIYQPYEIAPYSTGMPEARIRLEDMMRYLSASFRKAYF